jgi:hypothetical protein
MAEKCGYLVYGREVQHLVYGRVVPTVVYSKTAVARKLCLR